jgi:beta-N-acetylhexosaminidase
MTIRRVLLGLIGLLVVACTRQVAVESEEATAAPGRFSAAHDTTQVPRSRLDSLFVAHGLPLLPSPDTTGAAQWVDSTLATLTLEAQIGQLFIVELPAPHLLTLLRNPAADAVRDYGVGGFLVPRLLEPQAVFDLTRRLQALSRLPLFFAADYERGVGRFNNPLTELPSNMALGATGDTLMAALAGRLTALEARSIGVNLLLAPVVDVNSNPDNPIINIRAYGEDPVLVAQLARAFTRESQRLGVLTTWKHFPGHGNTSLDSHTRLGLLEGNRASLDGMELYPYRDVLQRGEAPAGVMAGHLWAAALDPSRQPATFSRPVLDGLLRDSLGFAGMILTDDLSMGALHPRYPLAERVLRPLEAGADVLVGIEDFPGAVAAVRHAVQTGQLGHAVLAQHVRRVLQAKAAAGLHRQRQADPALFAWLMAEKRGEPLAEAVAARAITRLKGTRLPDGTTVALVQVTNQSGAESIRAAMDTLGHRLRPDGLDLQYEHEPSTSDQQQVLAAAGKAGVVVVALYLRIIAGRGHVGLEAGQKAFVQHLIDLPGPSVLVLFGNPYAAREFPGAESVYVAYDQSQASVHTMVRVLQGQQAAQGRLPVTIPP